MTLNEYELDNSYAPSTLLNLVPEILGKMISVRGIYKKDNKNNNNKSEKYLDKLCDENSNTKLIVEVNKNLRKTIKHGKTYYFKGVLVSDETNNSQTSIKFIIDDFHERKIANDISVLSEKRNLGYRQPDLIFKNKIKNNETPEIAVILCNENVFDNEISTKLADFAGNFQFSTFQTDFASKKSVTDIIAEIKRANNFDAVVLMDNSELDTNTLFDDDSIAQKLVLSKYPLISMTTEQNLLIDKISDMQFAAPEEFAQYLHDIASESLDNSSAVKKSEASSEEIEKLQTKLKKSLKTIDQLEETIEKLSSQIDDDEDKYVELEQAKLGVDQKIQEVLHEIVNLETKNSELENEIHKLLKDIDRESLENSSLNNLIRELKVKNTKIESQLNDARIENQHTSNELGNQVAKRTKTEQKYSDLKQLTIRVKNEKELIEKNRNSLATTLEKMNKKNQSLIQIVQQRKEQLSNREKMLAELTSQIEQKHIAFTNLETKTATEFEQLKQKNLKMEIIFSAIALVIGLLLGFIV